MIEEIILTLEELGNPADAEAAQRFFKTGPGEYGFGDVFLGIRNPILRGMVKYYQDLPLSQVSELLQHRYHEARFLALIILVRQFERGSNEVQQHIFDLYLQSTTFINNWDLVDCSCYKILGAYLLDKDPIVLNKLGQSDSIWERRIAIVSTYEFIRKGRFSQTLLLAQTLLLDEEDLIHKAVGWMLREVGNRNNQVMCDFLNQHYQNMPRTMLRYAIEKLPEEIRQSYLRGTI